MSIRRRTFWLLVQVSCGCFVGGLLAGAVGIVLVARAWEQSLRPLSLANLFLGPMFLLTALGAALSFAGLVGTWKRRLEEGDRSLAGAALALNMLLASVPLGIWLYRLLS